MSELLNSLLVGFSVTAVLAVIFVSLVSFVLWEIPFRLKNFEDRESNLALFRVFLSMGFFMAFIHYVNTGTT